MKRNSLIPLFVTVHLLFAEPAPTGQPAGRADELTQAIERLRPLHKELGAPKPGDWLYVHAEPGQTFLEYTHCNPRVPTGRRRVIYIQPLGEFSDTQRKIIELTADFLGRYYNLPTKINEPLPLSIVPATARRRHPSWGMKQILSTYVLRSILRPRLPPDAAVYIAFTACDLWPGRGWNFVFGQASLKNRVGVFSLYRNGNPDDSPEAFRLCLRRTLKTASHETGHMFSMKHCVEYQCNMCGSNSRQESDRRPLVLCPECMAKVCWSVKADPVDRYAKLAEFCEAHKLEDEARFYRKSLKALSAGESPESQHKNAKGRE